MLQSSQVGKDPCTFLNHLDQEIPGALWQLLPWPPTFRPGGPWPPGTLTLPGQVARPHQVHTPRATTIVLTLIIVAVQLFLVLKAGKPGPGAWEGLQEQAVGPGMKESETFLSSSPGHSGQLPGRVLPPPSWPGRPGDWGTASGQGELGSV